MSDSSEDEVSIEVPYSRRPEWADIKPIFQVILRNFGIKSNLRNPGT